MLSSMFDTLHTKLELKENAVDILDIIQGKFDRKDKLALMQIKGKYSTAKMKISTLVRNHVMMMTNDFTKPNFIGQ